MNLVVISYSHHGFTMGKFARNLGHEIVGVFDDEDEPRKQMVQEFNCPGYELIGTCLDQTQPDAVLVAGKHIEIPGYLQACVERRIPYLVDKPFADCASRLRPIAEESDKQGIHSFLTLPNRASRVNQIVEEMIADGTFGELVLYSCRLNNGSPNRYDPTPSYWLNDSKISGGGCWAVESAHGIDTFLQFAGQQSISVVGAVISNVVHQRNIEDLGVGMFRTTNGITGIVESGYTTPADHHGDHFERFIGTKAQVFQLHDRERKEYIEVRTSSGVEFFEELSHEERFQNVIENGLQSIQKRRKNGLSIMDAVNILEIQDAVYDFARKSKLTNGPYELNSPANPL